MFRHAPLRLFAAIDFAFSLNSKADYTALVVVGVDPDNNVYVVDIIRFKTNRITDYFDHILEAHVRWGFRKIRAEVNVAQEVIVSDLKDRIRRSGNALSIDPHRPTKHMGTKEERMQAILSPRYENMSVWHYEGGLCQELEEELRQHRPKHDDIKDALANAIDIAIAPKALRQRREEKVVYHSRFGGVAA